MTMTHPSITLNLKNIGPFAQANIELKPITIITGESSTGKTYLLKLLYLLSRTLSSVQEEMRKRPSGISMERINEIMNSLASHLSLDLLKEGEEAGEVSCEIHTEEARYELSFRTTRKGIASLHIEKELLEQLKTTEQPLIKELLIPEDRLFMLKYLLPACLEMLSKSMIELIQELQKMSYGISISYPESLRALARSIPHYTIDLLMYMVLTITNPILFKEALDLSNKTIKRYGAIEPKMGIGITFISKTGYRADINTAPEAIAATTIPLLPLPSFLRERAQVKLMMIDHLETSLTPPLAEALTHTLIEHIMKNKHLISVMVVHDMDTLVSLDIALRELMHKNMKEQVAVYEFIHEEKEIITRQLKVSSKEGIEIPSYLDKYVTKLGSQQAKLLSTWPLPPS